VAPVAGGDELFARATGPTWYLRLDDGDHTPLGFDTDGERTEEALTAFLDAELEGDADARARLPDEVAARP
jgi:hypothetical protein